MGNVFYLLFISGFLIFEIAFVSKSLGKFEDTAELIRKIAQAERELRLCAELSAAKENLIDAAGFLSTRLPDDKSEIESKSQSIIAEIDSTLSRFNLSEGRCSHPDLSALAAEIYRQKNDKIDDLLPNWYWRFVRKD